jgi:hypothetical protein
MEGSNWDLMLGCGVLLPRRGLGIGGHGRRA